MIYNHSDTLTHPQPSYNGGLRNYFLYLNLSAIMVNAKSQFYIKICSLKSWNTRFHDFVPMYSESN